MSVLEDEGRAARAKYQIPQGEYKTPNQCIGCLKTDNSEFGMADLGRDIDWYGVPYLCKDCAIEVAMLFGSIPETVYKGLREEVSLLQERVESLEQENHGLRMILDGHKLVDSANSSGTFSGVGTNLPPPEHPGGISEESGTTEPPETHDSPDESREDDGDGVSESSVGEQSSGSPEVDESSDNEGPDDVPGDSDSELSRILRGE